MGFWNRLIGKTSDNSSSEDFGDDDLINYLVDAYLQAVESGQEADFHGEVLLKSSLLLPRIRETVPIKSWFFQIITAIPVPKIGRLEALAEAIEMIDRQLLEKGLLPERAYRNISLVRGGFIKQRQLLREAADDLHLYGRAEKRKFATTLNMRDAISASPVFSELKSELQLDENGEYSGEKFDVFCPHINDELNLWVNLNISDMPQEVRRITFLQFDLCYEEDLAQNHAYLFGPGWDVTLFGFPECCKEEFDSYLNALQRALGGQILEPPR